MVKTNLTRGGLIANIKVYISKGYWIDKAYNIWDSYWFEIIWYKLIKLTLWEQWVKSYLDVYNSIANTIVDTPKYIPATSELWYENSISWLYNHYKYWPDNNSNCILINWRKQIVAIQYNWLKKTTQIRSLDCYNLPNYILINNKHTIEGVYNLKDFKELEPMIKEKVKQKFIFNN